MRRPVLVIGAGVAGSCCAVRLRQLGIEVHLAEKQAFPRAKVCGCCIGGAGLELLEQLSLRHWVVEHGATTSRWCGSVGGRRIELPLPQGVAISRERLDAKLLAAAIDAGAEAHVPVAARIERLNADSVLVGFRESSQAEGSGEIRFETYGAVILASGLNAEGSQRLLPWREKPNGPFGVAFFAHSDTLPRGIIHMACDDDGYVGLVRLEDDRVDIAAALAAGKRSSQPGTAKQRIDGILRRSCLEGWDYDHPSAVMTTPPLRRVRQAGVGRVIAIGDAAGYVEPFTGEGMTWGMISAVAAADLIAQSGDDLSRIGEVWDRQLRSLLRTRRLACRTLTGALQYPLARRAMGSLLSRWPRLASPLIGHLNHLGSQR